MIFKPIGIVSSSSSYSIQPVALTETHIFTGAEVTKTVASSAILEAKMWGGGGNGGHYGTHYWGGGGGFIHFRYSVSAGDIITLMVGEGAPSFTNFTNARGGWPDGGMGTYGDATGGGGAGSTRLFVNSTLVAVAGGGGSAAGWSGHGGTGGGTTGGVTGTTPAATQTEGGFVAAGHLRNGLGPITYETRFDRTGGHGGNDLYVSTGDDGGGGGGGYYGGAGGGGDARAGGGGSGYAHPACLFANLANGTTDASNAIMSDDLNYPALGVGKGVVGNNQGGHGAIWYSLL